MNPKRDNYIDTILYNYQNQCGSVSIINKIILVYLNTINVIFYIVLLLNGMCDMMC